MIVAMLKTLVATRDTERHPRAPLRRLRIHSGKYPPHIWRETEPTLEAKEEPNRERKGLPPGEYHHVHAHLLLHGLRGRHEGALDDGGAVVVEAGVPGVEDVLKGADVIDGDVQDVDLGQLLALAAPR